MTMVNSEDTIQSYAILLREAYRVMRQQWSRQHNLCESDWGNHPIPRYDGGADASGRNFKSVWVKLARFVVANGLNPDLYIRAQFRGRIASPPEPTQLMSSGALSVYHQTTANRIALCSARFLAQKTRYFLEVQALGAGRQVVRCSDDQINLSVLGNLSLPLSALFRYCLGVRGEREIIIHRFRNEATIQYIGDQEAYDQVWGTWIPDELRLASNQLKELVAAPECEPPPALLEFCERQIIID